MVGIIIMRVVGKDHVSLAVAHQVDERHAYLERLIEQLVIIIQTDVLRTDDRGGVGRLLLAHAGNLLLAERC